MPYRTVISKLGGPEVLEYQEYALFLYYRQIYSQALRKIIVILALC